MSPRESEGTQMKEELNKRRMNECASEEMAGQVGTGKNHR